MSYSEDDDVSESGGYAGGAGGAFSALADIGDEGWEQVKAKHSASKKAERTNQPKGSHAAISADRRSQTSALVAQSSRPGPSNLTRAPAERQSASNSQQQQQQQQHKQEFNREYYKAFMKVAKNATGDVAVRFYQTEVVTVRANGDVILTNGGFFKFTTLCAMNDVLAYIHFKIDYSGGVGQGNWNVADNSGMHMPFEQGMVIKARTATDRGRAEMLFRGWSADRRAAASGQQTGAAASRPAPQGRAPNAPSMIQSGGLTLYAPGSSTTNAPAATYTAACHPASLGPSSVANQAYEAQQQHLRAMSNGSAAMPLGAPRGYVPNVVLLQQQQQQQRASMHAASMPAQFSAYHPRETSHAGQEALNQKLFEALALQGDDLDEDHACIVCFSAMRNTICLPCGHMVLCAGCCTGMYDKGGMQCPVCREEVSAHLTVDD